MQPISNVIDLSADRVAFRLRPSRSPCQRSECTDTRSISSSSVVRTGYILFTGSFTCAVVDTSTYMYIYKYTYTHVVSGKRNVINYSSESFVHQHTRCMYIHVCIHYLESNAHILPRLVMKPNFRLMIECIFYYLKMVCWPRHINYGFK